jgi:hypothetical protein
MKRIFLLIALLGASLTSFAQITLTGKVIDTQQEAVPFANVLLLQATDSALVKGQVTDLEGKFEITGVQVGKYLLKVQMMGYQTHILPTNVPSEGASFALPTITLTADATSLQEVKLTAEKPLFENQPDRTVVNVQNSPTLAGSTALDILARSPNVEVYRNNNSLALNGRQGVIVMINGKPTRMEQNAVIQYLASMSANNIKKIELIHTPPASFDAQGNAGIINIELAKNEEDGTHGAWTLNAGYGQRPKAGGSFNLYHNAGKLRTFVDVSSSNTYTLENSILSNTAQINGQSIQNTSNSQRPAFLGLQNGRAGIEYQISPRTSLGVLASVSRTVWKLDAVTENTTLTNGENPVLARLTAVETNRWFNVLGNFNVQHTFAKEGRLSFDFDYVYYHVNNPADYTLDNEPFISKKVTPIQFKVFKLDYSKKVNDKLRFEMGAKSTFSTLTNDISVARLQNNVWQNDANFTSILYLRENIFALYASGSYIFSPKTSLNVGLRFEQTHTLLTDQEGKIVLGLDYGKLFPTVSFSHKINDNNQIQLAYNERITRPSFGMLAPAFFFFGPNHIFGGNPALRPTMSRQAVLTYSYKNFTTTLQASQERNSLLFQPLTMESDNIVVMRGENMKGMQVAMLALSYTAEAKWWKSSYNLSGFGQRLQPTFKDQTVTRTDFYLTFNTTQTFRLPKDFTLEITNQTRSKRNFGLGTIPWIAGVSAGITKKVGENHTLTLNCQDIFNTGSFWRATYTQPALGLDYMFYYDNEGTIFRLTYTHCFGRQGKKSDRKTASDEERQRVN